MTPHDHLVAHEKELLARVERALRERIDPRHRKVILLHKFRGLSFGRIARVMGLESEGVARSWYDRGLEELCQLLSRRTA